MKEIRKILQSSLSEANASIERFAGYRDEALQQAEDWERHRAEAERRKNELEDFFAGTVLAETEIGEEVSEGDDGGGAQASTR